MFGQRKKKNWNIFKHLSTSTSSATSNWLLSHGFISHSLWLKIFFLLQSETKLLYDDADFPLKHQLCVFLFLTDNKPTYKNSNKKSFIIDASKGKSASWSGKSDLTEDLIYDLCLWRGKLSWFLWEKLLRKLCFPLKWILIFGRRSKRGVSVKWGRSSSKTLMRICTCHEKRKIGNFARYEKTTGGNNETEAIKVLVSLVFDRVDWIICNYYCQQKIFKGAAIVFFKIVYKSLF